MTSLLVNGSTDPFFATIGVAQISYQNHKVFVTDASGNVWAKVAASEPWVRYTGIVGGIPYLAPPADPNKPGTPPSAVQNLGRAAVVGNPTQTSIEVLAGAPINGTGPFTYAYAYKLHSASTYGATGFASSADVTVSGLTAGTSYDIEMAAVDVWNQQGPWTSITLSTATGFGGIVDTGYIEALEWVNNTSLPITYFSVTYMVPPAPASNDGQYLYLWSGIETSDALFLLQPVLQWGAAASGGGAYWSLSTYWLSSDTSTGQSLPFQATAPVQVAPGTTVQGTVTCTAGTRGQANFAYTAQFVGYPGTVFSISGVEELNFPIIALEAYPNVGSGSSTLASCSDYPNTDFTTMGSIVVRTGTPPNAGSAIAPSWSNIVKFTDCGEGISGSGSSYNFYYRNAPGAVGQASPNGTVITPGSGSFTDGTNVYTIVVAGSGGANQVYKNGNPIAAGRNTGKGEWYNGQAYFQDQTSLQWYIFDGTNFNASPAPGGSTGGQASPSGTVIVPGSGSFTDGTNVYTIVVNGTGGTNQVYENGAGIAGAQLTDDGYWYNGQAYFLSHGQWYLWNGSAFSAVATPPGAPTATGGGGTGTPPGPPTMVWGETIGANQLVVSWTASTNAVSPTTYTVKTAPARTGPWTSRATVQDTTSAVVAVTG